MKNICIVSAGIYPIPDVKGGAVERLMTMIAEDNEVNQRFHITILTCKNNEAIVKQQNFKNTRFVNLKPYNSQRQINLARRIKGFVNNRLKIKTELSWLMWLVSPFNRYITAHRNDFDLIIQESPSTDFCCTAARLADNKRMAVHLHENVFGNKLFEKTFGNVVAVSDFIMNQYRQTSLLPIERTATIFNGIATENFQRRITCEERISLRDKLGIKKDDFVIIFCGRIVWKKGVKELITAISELNIPNMKLVIMGASDFGKGDYGDYPKEVRKLVDDNKDKIVFTGFVNNHELYKYHQCADLGVIPSLYNDPCPLSMFEMITSGLPTIATRAGGMTEIGTTDTTQYLSLDNIVEDLKLSIKALYTDEQKREEMKSAAFERSKHFVRNRFFKDFCDTIEMLIDKNKQL